MMGSYFSGSKRKEQNETDFESKRRKLGKDVGVVKSKEYQIVYGVGPIVLEELPAHIRSMFVFKRTSSMYFDEDGDLAHEFYVEERKTPNSKARWSMKRVLDNLIPQGDVILPVPRIRNNVPVVLLDSNATIVPR